MIGPYEISRLVRKHGRYLWLFPGIVPRVLSNYVQLTVLRRPVLRTVEFALTYRCQAKCAHCSAHYLGDATRAEATTAEAVDWARQCLDLGTLNVNLTGGEALMRDDLEAIAAACRPRSTVVSVASNGLMLTDERVRRLRKAGVGIVTISLDSTNPLVHDGFRGVKGCHDAAIRGAVKVRDAGMIPFLCAVATSSTIRSGETEALSDLAGELGMTMTLQTACPVGKWTGNHADLLSPEDRKVFYALTRRPHMRWEGATNYLHEGCPAGVEKLYISPYGDVMPCPLMHIRFWNLREEPLRAIWRRMTSKDRFDRVKDGCPLAEDSGFQKEILGPLNGRATLPMDYRDHPRFQERRQDP